MEPEVRHKPVRYYEIDALRFIAAIVVVLYHLTYRGYHADNLSPVAYPGLGDVFKYGFLGVELFFIISGYVMLMSAQGKTIGQFFTSRVTRLYPAYWVATTLTFIVVRLFGPHVHELGWSPIIDAPVKGYFYNLTMLQTFLGINNIDGVAWTLAIEIYFYFWIAVMIAFGWLKHLLPVLVTWLAFCAFSGPVVNSNLLTTVLFTRFAPFFIAGMTFFLLQTNQAARWKLYTLLGVSFLLCLRSARTIVNEGIVSYHEGFSILVAGGLITLFFVLFLLIAYRKLTVPHSKWVAWAGFLCYPIYLTHHNIGYVVLQRLGGKVDKYVLLIGIITLVLLLAYLLHEFVERRGSKLLNRWLQRLLARF
ncbi:MAG: acyltransferase family protein [Janthinobacterium lividum]